ncbi:hypothetical protein [Proteus terrae]|uniref:phage tail fiber protein n=1 Tax=Proteus terrae TaxID=1574161 RepID=UPI0032DB0D31
MIYTTGTVSTVSGSAIVKGTGTKFKNNNPAINIGMTILIKSGNTNIPYMIKSVNSDTELVLAQPALATATNTTFSIHITEPDNNSDAARTMVAINSYVEYFLDAMNTWMTQTGQTKIEMPNGEVVTLDSIKKMQEDISKKADDNKTVHIGDFGVGASALSSDKISPPSVMDANSINHGGFYAGGGNGALNFIDPYMPIINASRTGGDGTGSVLQIQATTDFNAGEFGYRRRSNNLWNEWQLLANKTTNNTQRFNGQLMSYQGLYSSDKSNPTNYFGLLRAEKGVPYGFYLSYDGSGNSIRFPERKGGTLMLVGDHGLGSNATYRGNDELKDTLIPTNFFSMGGGVTSDHFGYYGSGVNIYYNSDIAFRMFVSGLGILTSEYYSKSANLIRRHVTWGTLNTTVDPQGFIKKASPIVNIHQDGTFTTNDESEGVTVTRVAKGEYLIEGVLGFNSDAGWGGVDGGIEIPFDVNKQPLIWVDAEINKDGSILVKTYHRTHPNAPKFARNDIDGFNDGDPIDIPDGRFISVRVQMPEQSIYNVRMREMEEAQKAEEERRQKEEEMKAQFGLGENDALL